ITPLCPVESWCTSDPCSTQVTISMSWCGWVSKPVPGSTMSSLLTSSSPWWVLRRSKCWPKEKECLESSQPKLVLNRSAARRTSTVGVRLTVLTDAVLSLSGRGRESGVLDGGDLELQDDLVADQDAAGLERSVPGDAVVLAADGDRAVEADPLVAVRVLRGALELEGHRDPVRHVLDGQVAGDLEGGLVHPADVRGDEGDPRVLLEREEVVGAQVLIALCV